MRHPNIEIVAAMAWRGMDKARAGVVSDVISVKERHVEVISRIPASERMRHDEQLKFVIWDITLAGHMGGINARSLKHIGRKSVGYNIFLAGLCPIVG
jgi:hypothetical protein